MPCGDFSPWPSPVALTEQSDLFREAARLLSAALQADLYGFAEIADSEAPLTLTIGDTAERSGREDSVIKLGNLGRSASIVGYALSETTAVCTSNLAVEERFNDLLLQGFSVEAAMVVPLHLGNRPCGTIGAFCACHENSPPRKRVLPKRWGA